MSDFDAIAQRLAQSKREQDARDSAAKLESAAALNRALEAQDDLMARHVAPVLREARESLDRAEIPAKLNLDRNAPTFAKELQIGRAGMAQKQFMLRVEPVSGRFRVSVEGTRRKLDAVDADADGVRAAIVMAYEFILEEWHGLRARQ